MWSSHGDVGPALGETARWGWSDGSAPGETAGLGGGVLAEGNSFAGISEHHCGRYRFNISYDGMKLAMD